MGSTLGTLSPCTSMGDYGASPQHDNLSSGDVVWLVPKQLQGQATLHGVDAGDADGNMPFLLRVQHSWRPFSQVGFLVRTGPGPPGLFLCMHETERLRRHGAVVAGEQHEIAAAARKGAVVIVPFAQVLQSGAWQSIAVSRLAVPLSQTAASQLHAYAKSSVGSCLNERVVLVLPRQNKMFCNTLVARALVATGRYVCVDTLYGPVKGSCAAARLRKPIMLVKQSSPTARISISSCSSNSSTSSLDSGGSKCNKGCTGG